MYRILEIDGQDFEESKGEADTVAGFIIEIAERIPKAKEHVPFLNYDFEIEVADNRRISTIKVRINEKKENETLGDESTS